MKVSKISSLLNLKSWTESTNLKIYKTIPMKKSMKIPWKSWKRSLTVKKIINEDFFLQTKKKGLFFFKLITFFCHSACKQFIIEVFCMKSIFEKIQAQKKMFPLTSKTALFKKIIIDLNNTFFFIWWDLANLKKIINSKNRRKKVFFSKLWSLKSISFIEINFLRAKISRIYRKIFIQ